MLLLPLILATTRQAFWADVYKYPIRTEESPGKINYIMLAQDLIKVPCGRQSAGWLRVLWHDFGTFDIRDLSGGVDGSVLYELDRLENTRLDVHTYFLANKARQYGITLADTISLAGLIAVRRCGGPKVPFHYGRQDVAAGNPTGRFAFTNATFALMQDLMMDRNGWSFPQFVASLGVGHTIGKLNGNFGSMKAGPLDSTVDEPNSYDNLFFQELLLNKTNTTRFASDLQLLTDPRAKRVVRRMARNQAYFFQLSRSVLLWMANAGWESLFYLNIWKFLEDKCVPTSGFESTSSTMVSVEEVTTDTSQGEEVDNEVKTVEVEEKPEDQVEQASLADSMAKAFESVKNEIVVEVDDLPEPTPVELK